MNKFIAFLAISITLFFLLPGCGQDNINQSIDNTKPSSSKEKTPANTSKEKTPVNTSKESDPSEVSEVLFEPSTKNISNESLSWFLKPNLNHSVPEIPANIDKMLKKYKGFYVLPNYSNKIYLTFDEGYELGYTSQILDILKANNVKATFFITGHYLKSQPDLVKRMVKEGHMVANHTWNHPDLSKVNEKTIKEEITKLENEFNRITQHNLGKYLRPPQGTYSEKSLLTTSQLGYHTVFWSIAFHDWDPNKQPGKEFAHKYVIDHIHPGAVILLHAVSKSNTEALNDIIIDLKNEGYRFSLFN